jgi:putative endonuclease
MKTQIRGAAAEALARHFLEQSGLVCIECNFLCRMGEIDLIMRDGEQLVFVEVRYRKNSLFGTPQASVDNNKQRKLIRTAAFYLQQHGINSSCRFDVVAISGDQQEPVWIPNAFGIN